MEIFQRAIIVLILQESFPHPDLSPVIRIELRGLLWYTTPLPQRAGNTPKSRIILSVVVLKTTLRQHLENIYPNHELTCWFDPLGVDVDYDTKAVRIFFPHALFRRWFMDSIRPAFEEHAKSVIAGFSLLYEGISGSRPAVESQKPVEPTKTPRAPLAPEPPASPLPGVAAKVSSKAAPSPGRTRQDSPGIPDPAPSPAPAAASSPSHAEGFISTLLGRYTFEGFLVNRKNDFPLAAAKEAVAKAKCPAYTPLVIYGQSGSGKTHLLGAMANFLLSEKPALSFFYGNADLLQTRIMPGSLIPLDEKVVFMDDAQGICTNQQSQDELIVALDMFRTENRLLVLAFDTHPANCSGLSQKLIARLTAGLVLELKKPDIDIRRQYAQQKNQQLELGLSREQVLALAQRYQDFRTIDGALTRLKAYRSLVNRQDTDLANILGPGNEQKLLTPAVIIAHAAKLYSVSPEDIVGKGRGADSTLARQLAIYLCRDLLGLSLVQVGHVFGGRDHSSIHYTLKKVTQLQQSNKDIHNALAQLKLLCQTGVL